MTARALRAEWSTGPENRRRAWAGFSDGDERSLAAAVGNILALGREPEPDTLWWVQ